MHIVTLHWTYCGERVTSLFSTTHWCLGFIDMFDLHGTDYTIEV